jgi:hypothetical protein
MTDYWWFYKNRNKHQNAHVYTQATPCLSSWDVLYNLRTLSGRNSSPDVFPRNVSQNKLPFFIKLPSLSYST